MLTASVLRKGTDVVVKYNDDYRKKYTIVIVIVLCKLLLKLFLKREGKTTGKWVGGEELNEYNRMQSKS